MQEDHIVVRKTARYFTLGELNKKTENVWLVCHGYAQMAKGFIQAFEPLVDEKTVIIAPEGLSRFYTKGFYGKVGATWMTSEDREHEIEDYVNYLQALYEHLKTQVSKTAKFQMLGFSQGCATICRWVCQKQPDFDALWICSGSIPPDLDWKIFSKLSKMHQFNILYGTDDPFIGEGDIEKMEAHLQNQGIEYALHAFDGAHKIEPALLSDLSSRD